jgi:serine/threonine protein kinase
MKLQERSLAERFRDAISNIFSKNRPINKKFIRVHRAIQTEYQAMDMTVPSCRYHCITNTTSRNASDRGAIFEDYDSNTGIVAQGRRLNLLELGILETLRSERNIITLLNYEMEGDDIMVFYMPETINSLDVLPEPDEHESFVSYAMQLFCDLFCGLISMYKHSIIHREIKRLNIVYSTTEYVFQITEFDQAIKYERGQRFYVGGEVFGTRPYVAPEVKNGSDYNEKIDVYSAGKIIKRVIKDAQDETLQNLFRPLYEPMLLEESRRPDILQVGQMLINLDQKMTEMGMPVKIPPFFRQDS